jgi:hypothetical protein
VSDATIPEKALDAAREAYEAAKYPYPKPVHEMLADVLAAARPHLACAVCDRRGGGPDV